VTPAARLRGRLGRFALVGTGATALDIGLLLWLRRRVGLPLVLADFGAVSAAAGLSYVVHREFSFQNDPFVRWVHQPSAFLSSSALAAGVDMFALGMGLRRGMTLAGSKVVAVAAAGAVRLVAYRWVLFEGVRQRQEHRLPRPPAPGDRRLSVVVPAYRERERIEETVQRLRDALAPAAGAAGDAPGGVEIVVVDDGSGDGTAEAARRAAARPGPPGVEVVVVERPVNRGKGAAVRAGVLAARGRAVAFTDADLAYAPDQVLDLLDAIEDGWDVVVGSRHHRGTTTLAKATRLREVGSRLINLCTLALLLGQYRDTQCGLKAFRSDVARLLFGQTRVDGFAFDIELFHLAERYELSLVEAPVQVQNSERSTVKVVRDGARLVRDLVRIRGFAKKGFYQAALPDSLAVPGPTATVPGVAGPDPGPAREAPSIAEADVARR
jgi:dolichyl-phosphate beta-glucosyltransferase